MSINDKILHSISLITKIREVDNIYISFEVHLHPNNTAKYTIYTESLGHQYFDSIDECIEYLKELRTLGNTSVRRKELIRQLEILHYNLYSLEGDTDD